jgi:UDP-N-acetylmuramate dehydrogenase
MSFREEFAEIIRPSEPLAPFTHLKLGGPAEMFVQPQTPEEAGRVVARCNEEKLPLRVLGNGCNLLVPDEGVKGVVMRLSAPAFTEINAAGKRVGCGSGAALSALISHAARHNLGGIETLVGIPGTVGGALRCNAGDRNGEIGSFVARVEVLNGRGEREFRERDDLHFADHRSDLDEPVILRAEFELEPEGADAIHKRMLRAWIQRKALQPFSFQSAARLFRDPRGSSAATLIDQANLVGTRVGGAELSDRNSNYVVAQPKASARDILRLIELVKAKVRESSGVELERELILW